MRKHEPKNAKTIHVNLPGIIPVRKPPRVNFDLLSPAVVDGILTCEPGDEVILRKDHLNDKKLYLCTVTSITESGDLFLYNLTLGQVVTFSIKNPMNIRKLH